MNPKNGSATAPSVNTVAAPPAAAEMAGSRRPGRISLTTVTTLCPGDSAGGVANGILLWVLAFYLNGEVAVTQHFDAIIIGTGQAGPSLAARLAGAGMKVAIVERKKFGGTCVNTGCIPTKTLVASAYAAHVARRAAEYGVVIDGDVRVDMKRVKARKDEVSGRSNQGIERWLKDPAQDEEGGITEREKGTPQGGVRTLPTKLPTFW